MKATRKYFLSSLAGRLTFSAAIALLLLLPCSVFADSYMLVRLVEEVDNIKLDGLKNVKLSATVKMDKNGDLVVNCLNLALPVARNPLNDNPAMQKLAQRTRVQIDPKGNGVMVKLAFAF